VIIKSDEVGRTFECVLHFVIYSGSTLYASSFAGSSSAAWGIAANIINGSPVMIYNEDHYVQRLYPERGSYKKIESRVGDVYHCLVIHKSAVFSENSTRPLVLAVDGDVRKSIGRYVTSRFTVPPEWESEYLDLFETSEMSVLSNPLIETWRNIKAVRLDWVTGVTPYEVTDATVRVGIDAALKSGRLKVPFSKARGVFDPSMSMRDYLKANTGTLKDQLKAIRPRHDPATGKLNPAIGQMDRIPFPAQSHVIQGLVKSLAVRNSVEAVGDMGSGKSIIALGVANCLSQGKKSMSVLLSAPGIMIPKWEKREIAETLSGAKVRVLRSTEDAAQYVRLVREGYEPDGLEFVLVGIDRAKLGPEPWFAGVWKRIKGNRTAYCWHCPDCGQPLLDISGKYDSGEEPYLQWSDVAHGDPPEKSGRLPNGLPEGFIPKWKLPSKHKRCSCGASLWRPALKSRGETPNKPRWFVSLLLKRLKRHFDLFVMDEVHQTRAADSGRGDAFAQMIKASKKVLSLTGTLVNGMSTSVKELIWRTDPSSMLREGFDHKTSPIAWAKKYGVLEKITKNKGDADTGIVTRRKRNQSIVHERPGIAPQLVINHLLHRAAFLELGDLELPLVELKEIPVFVNMDQDHADEYKKFHETLHTHCMNARASGQIGAFSRFIPATINYADRPDMGAYVEIGRNKDGRPMYKTSAPSFPEDSYHAKEREMVKIIRENLAQDRGCIVYCNYTDAYGVHHRVRDVLAAHEIDAQVLESYVSPEKRIEWLAQQEEKGSKVLVCNMRLVETGLDLISWPTIMFYQMNYNIDTVRQASRRAWRIGQTRECRVYYLVYESSQQAAQFEYCMVKRAHALLAEGRLDRSELAAFGRESTSLAMDLADCLAGEEAARRWKDLARRDMDESLEVVEESRFMDVLNKRTRELTRRTLELCGLPTDHLDEEVEEIVSRPNVLDLAAFLPKRRKRVRKVATGQVSIFDLLDIV